MSTKTAKTTEKTKEKSFDKLMKAYASAEKKASAAKEELMEFVEENEEEIFLNGNEVFTADGKVTRSNKAEIECEPISLKDLEYALKHEKTRPFFKDSISKTNFASLLDSTAVKNALHNNSSNINNLKDFGFKRRKIKTSFSVKTA